MSWAIKETSGELTDQVLNALPKPDVTLEKDCSAIKYVHRKLANADLYFLFNEGTEQLKTNVALAGKGEVQEWDAMSGNIKSLDKISSEEGSVVVALELDPYESRFIVVGKLASEQ